MRNSQPTVQLKVSATLLADGNLVVTIACGPLHSSIAASPNDIDNVARTMGQLAREARTKLVTGQPQVLTDENAKPL